MMIPNRFKLTVLYTLSFAFANLSIVRPAAAIQSSTQGFTVEQILGFPSPENLTASPADASVAWTFNERGVRNVYVANGPEYAARKVTGYTQDDGQELTQLAFSKDGRTLVYVRGGDHGSSRPTDAPNPAGDPIQPKVQIWSVAAAGGQPKLISDGDSPALSPDGQRVAFVRERRIWFGPIDGSRPAEAAFYARGDSGSPSWSPDGRTLAFVSDRVDHSFIGLFAPGQPVRFIAPATARDSTPVWSADGKRIAFLRQPGVGGTPRSPLAQPESPWTIMVAEANNVSSVATAVSSGSNPVDPILQNPGGIGLRWAADDTLVFMSYHDGFPHLYALPHPGAAGSRPMLLTPGSFMVEHVTLSPDGKTVVYTANSGPDKSDLDRRHLFKVSIGSDQSTPLTNGTGIEWSPVVTANGASVAFLASGPQKAPAPAVLPIAGGTAREVALDRMPSDFPAAQLVTPELVSFRASDGIEVHGQLFRPSVGPQRKPAVVYVHGGGPRQMLLGWHNRWEYANDYGANQYLASRGFVVLSVDYRLSVGYGQAFQFPKNTGVRGASEYRDILAAGKYLQARADVDPSKVGIWGASLGGYLTALALGRNSDVFASGVDVHGVHDRLAAINPTLLAHAMVGDGVSEADLRQAMKVAFESSPIAAVGTWKSPVLLIHGDDDRAVDFRQTVDLRRRLEEKGVKVEELVLPDDVHDSLLWRNWVASIDAMARFFEKTLKP